MAIQLPRRRDVRPSRKYAQPITRQMVKPVPGRRDPGARGGPSAAATPLAFGGGAGMEELGKGLMYWGEELRVTAQKEEAQKNAILLDRLVFNADVEMQGVLSNINTATVIGEKGEIIDFILDDEKINQVQQEIGAIPDR